MSCATLHFVGWVSPTPGFVGFRCTQTNLHFTGAITKCETQQWLALSFFLDQTGRSQLAGTTIGIFNRKH
jgi:hypothetical protein